MGSLFSKQLKRDDVQQIIDKVFYEMADTNQSANLDFQELYIAVLLVYNQINKRFPGPFNDPPTRSDVASMLRQFDTNKNNVLDREEFTAFVEMFTKDVAIRVSRNFFLIMILAPTLAMVTKDTLGELVPTLRPTVKKIPNSLFVPAATALYASAAKLATNTP